MRILILSINDWLGLKQRVHHITEYLSETNEVKYFCQTTWMKNNYTSYSKNEVRKHEIKVSDSLTVKRITVLPMNRLPLINRINISIKKWIISGIIAKFNPECIITTLPEQCFIIPKYYTGRVVYDCMDDHASFTNNEKINTYEKILVDRASVVTVSSERLKEKIQKYDDRKQVVLIKNATQFEDFYSYYISNNIHKIKPSEFRDERKIVGYFGVVREWFNADDILLSASEHQDCDYIIIGPVDNPNTQIRLSKANNVFCIGQRKYDELPKYLYYFDVCVMPFKLSELIKNVNPVKLYEYLSMGKPTVATYYDEIKEFEPYVYFSNDSKDFCNKISLALTEHDDDLVKKRIAFAMDNTWKVRAGQMMAAIEI